MAVAASPPPEPVGIPVIPLWRGSWSTDPRRRPIAELIEAVDLVAGAALLSASATPAGAPREDTERRTRFIEQARAEVLDLAHLVHQLADDLERTDYEDLADRCVGTALAQDADIEEVSGPGAEVLDREAGGLAARLRYRAPGG